MIPVDLLDRQGVAIQGVPYADRFVRAFLSGIRFIVSLLLVTLRDDRGKVVQEIHLIGPSPYPPKPMATSPRFPP